MTCQPVTPALLPTIPRGLLQLYWLPVRLTLKMQYAVVNGLTLGMLDDLTEEVEHALVEGADVLTVLQEKIQLMQQSPLTDEQRLLIARTSLEDAEGQIKKIVRDLLESVLRLPFNRLESQPSRRRFPVTLEGSVVVGQ